MMGGLGFGTDEAMILPPLDLMVMAAISRQAGYDVRIFDVDADPMDIDRAADVVRSFDPSFLVATASLATLNSDSEWIRNLSERLSKPICLKTFIREPAILQELLAKSKAPFAMVGEPDFEFLNILDGRSAKGTARLDPRGNVTVDPYLPIECLDDLPFAARDLLPHERYHYPLLGSGLTTMQTSRGCPYPCGYYCPYPMVEGKKWRPMTPDRIVREMRAVEKERQIRKILFRDATFTLNRDRILDMCSQLISERISIDWWCETRADLLDSQLLERMAAAGCRGINVGVESGNEDMIQSIGKRGLTLERLGESRREAARLGIRMHFLMQVGLPGETRRTLIDTLDLLQNLRPDTVGLTYTTPYPGTDLHRDATSKGWLSARGWEDYDAHTPILRTEDLSTDELITGRRMIENGFRLIRGGAGLDVWQPFYVKALQWAYGLDPNAASQWLAQSCSIPLWKRILRPLWRMLPGRIRVKIRIRLENLFR